LKKGKTEEIPPKGKKSNSEPDALVLRAARSLILSVKKRETGEKDREVTPATPIDYRPPASLSGDFLRWKKKKKNRGHPTGKGKLNSTSPRCPTDSGRDS